ncbi:blue copper protein 1a [Ricinus communis]|uniref:blue copper protein 1a n=1 Tax=Ricinus communis TaxID=3988 RepID=UPI00201A963A|nr:blue copper protein 1a [Ricinus communis]
MASHGSILILVLPVAIVPMFSLAKEYIVGDETGWTIAFDYQAWAQGKDFRGGDKLGKDLISRYPDDEIKADPLPPSKPRMDPLNYEGPIIRARSKTFKAALYSFMIHKVYTTIGAHNVFRVNRTAFHNCNIPPLDQALATGNDTIVLATPGKKWYICGVGKHCEVGGQKLTITVQSEAPAPSPSMVPSPLGGMLARKRLFINFLMWG